MSQGCHSHPTIGPLASRLTLVDTISLRSWVLAAAFYFGIISPFVIRLGKESVQVAELLSQLPEDLDAEGLVKSMMMDQRQRGSSSKKEERRRSSLVMAPPLSPIKSGRTSIEIAGPPLALDQGIGRRGNRRVSVENT